MNLIWDTMLLIYDPNPHTLKIGWKDKTKLRTRKPIWGLCRTPITLEYLIVVDM